VELALGKPPSDGGVALGKGCHAGSGLVGVVLGVTLLVLNDLTGKELFHLLLGREERSGGGVLAESGRGDVGEGGGCCESSAARGGEGGGGHC